MKFCSIKLKKLVFKHYLKFIWTFGCFIGFTFNSYHIFDIFFEREIYAEFINYPTENIQTPALTICFYNPFLTSNEEQWPNFLTTSEKFFDNSIPIEKLFAFITIMNTSGDLVQYHRKHHRLSFFNQTTITYKLVDNICFHIDFAKLVRPKYTRQFMKSVLFPSAFFISMNVKMTKAYRHRMLAYVSQPGDLPDRMAAMVPGRMPAHSHTLSTVRKELNSLPAPYKTSCRDYKQSSFKNQQDCFHRCSIAWSLSNNLSLPLAVPYTTRDNRTITRPYVQIRKTTKPSFLAGYTEVCNQQCNQIDCQMVSFSAKTETTTPFGRTAYMLMLPTEPDFVINYHPKMMFTEFMALLASIFGLWLEISAYSLFEHILWFSHCGKKAKKSHIRRLARMIQPNIYLDPK